MKTLLGSAALAVGVAFGATASAQPDLRVLSVSVNLGGRPYLRPGFPVLAVAQVRNVGNQSTQTVTVRLLASIDQTITGSDVLLGQRQIPVLLAGETRTVSISGVVPAGTTARDYFIGVFFDSPAGDLNPSDNGLAGPDPTLITCNADCNGDRLVDFADLNTVLTEFGQAGTLNGDTNNDSLVDFADLNSVLTSFGQNCP